MGNLWLKIKVWTKLALFAMLTVYVLTFIAKNIGPKVDLWVWYFTTPISMPVLLLTLVAFLIGILGTILSRTTYKTIRQLRELSEKNRAVRLDRQVTEMRTKAAMLRSRGGPDPDARAAAEPDIP